MAPRVISTVLLSELLAGVPGAIRIGPFGSALKKDEYADSGVRVLGIEDVLSRGHPRQPKFIPEKKFRQLTQYSVRPGDILVTNMGTVGRAFLVPPTFETAIISSHLIKVTPDLDRVDAEYLEWALNAAPDVVAQIAADSRGAIMAGFNTSRLKQLRIPLPPMGEQRRIADILDVAEALRTKRMAALEMLETVSHSLFLEMFGTPGKDWPLRTIAEIGDSSPGAIRTGPFGSQLLHSEFVSEGVAVLGIDNAVANEFQWAKLRYITDAKYKSLQRYTVKPGDVLITIMGTCGRCAIVPDSIPLAINTKHLCCITLDRRLARPEYLHAYFLRHPLAQQYLSRRERGAIMSGLNMAIIKAMPIPLPPLPLQDRFAELLDRWSVLRDRLRASLEQLDSVSASLRYRAFRGEL